MIQKLIELFLQLVKQEGLKSTAIDGVVLMRVDHNILPVSVLQEPTMVFMLQGQKRSYLGNEIFSFRQGQCLIVSVSLPFDCDTVVSHGQPMLAISVRLEADVVNELLSKIHFDHDAYTPLTTGMSVIEYGQTIEEILLRLLDLIKHEQDVLILGDQLKRELLYRVIQHTGAGALKGLVAQGNLLAIYKLCEYLQHHYHEKITVEALAHQVNMSVSAFHKTFKKVTQLSPLQYLKIVRLHKAKQLLENHEINVSEISYQVGYHSISQFSREFKKHFGISPREVENLQSQSIEMV